MLDQRGKITPLYMLITALFITCLLTANIIAVKLADFGFGLFLPVAVIVFPLSYIFGDVLTEVYGFRQARLTIWLGFLCNLVMVVFFLLGGLLPAALDSRYRTLRSPPSVTEKPLLGTFPPMTDWPAS